MMRYCFAISMLVFSPLAGAAGNDQEAALSVSIKNHQFKPQQLTARANVPIAIRVKNLGSARMEFESSKPNVEKVVGGNSQAVIKLGSLAPGCYEFYDDFDQRDPMSLVVR